MEVDAEVEVDVGGELIVELVDGGLAVELCADDVVVGVVLDVKLGGELAPEVLVVVGMAPEEVTAAELTPASFDLTYFGTFRNIVVVIASVDIADHEREAAMAAVGSVAIYGTV